MEDIKVTSKIDLKAYYAISIRNYLRLRTIIIMLVAFGLIQFTIINGNRIDWQSEYIYIGFFLFAYAILIPVRIYFSCRRNMRTTAFLNEELHYQLNNDKIEFEGDTVKTSTGWNYIVKLIEREKYFLLRTAAGIHYLPKDGFESKEDMARLKAIAKEKGIKFSYK